MKTAAARLVREIQYLRPLRPLFFPRYVAQMSAAQLCFMCQCIAQTKDVAGAVVEIGVSRGQTTLFLNNYIDDTCPRKSYIAMDTFAGFVPEDMRVENEERGKDEDYGRYFVANKKKWFDGTMAMNGVTRVRSIECDINDYDIASLGPISFCLLDVDLYRPTKRAMPLLLDMMPAGSILVVDDCDPLVSRWDGAGQAYRELCAERGYPVEIVYGKLGVIRT